MDSIEILCAMKHRTIIIHIPPQGGFEPGTSESRDPKWTALTARSRGRFILSLRWFIMKTCLYKYIENFTSKNWTFSEKKKKNDSFHISTQNIDYGYSLEPPRQGGSNEYPKSMFLSRNKKNNVYPCEPQFYCIKVWFKGSILYRHVFVMQEGQLSVSGESVHNTG